MRIFPLALIAVGVFGLLKHFGWIDPAFLHVFWPLLLIGIGVAMLARGPRRRGEMRERLQERWERRMHRHFGPGWQPVRVRLPHAPTMAPVLFELRDAAAATSADTYRRPGQGLLDRRMRRQRSYGGSVTVVAPSCPAPRRAWRGLSAVKLPSRSGASAAEKSMGGEWPSSSQSPSAG